MARRFYFLMLWANGLLAAVASARPTWIEPDGFGVTPGATMQMSIVSASENAGVTPGSEPTPVARALAQIAGGPLPLVPVKNGEMVRRFALTLPRPGVAVVAVVLAARRRECGPEQAEARLRAVHAEVELRREWAASAGLRRWWENEVMEAKIYVRVGEPEPEDRTWAGPVGLDLEIVPERNPTMLRVGDEFPVRVLRAGSPLRGFVFTYVSADETREHVVVTDERGHATAVLDVAGIWHLHGTELRSAAGSDRDWDSNTTSLVVEVR